MSRKSGKLLEIERLEERLIVSPKDNLVSSNIKELRDELELLLEEEDFNGCTLDMDQVEIVDSKGVSFIVGLYKTLDKEKKNFDLTGVRREIEDLFSMMKLDEVLKMR